MRATAQTRWGDEAPRDVDSARERLLDAAERCFERFGLAKTTIEDVASAANVSRATVYRYFRSRDDLMIGVLLRESIRFSDRLAKHIAPIKAFDEMIVEGVMFTLGTLEENTVLSSFFEPDVIGITSSVASSSETLFEAATSFLEPIFAAAIAAHALREDSSLELLTEWTFRIILSLLTSPGPSRRTPQQTRRFLRMFFVPSILADRGPNSELATEPS